MNSDAFTLILPRSAQRVYQCLRSVQMQSHLDTSGDQQQFDAFAARTFVATFNRNYAPAYTRFETELEMVSKELAPRVNALDLGCGDGWTAELLASRGICGRYLGIDPAEKVIKRFNEVTKDFPHLKCTGIVEGGAWLTTLQAPALVRQLMQETPNLLLCHAVCHQLRKVTPDVAGVLAAAVNLLPLGGRVIVGDYFYPSTLSSSEVERSRDWIKAAGQNPTVREGFFSPEELAGYLREAGVEILRTTEGPSNASIALEHYVISGRRVR